MAGFGGHGRGPRLIGFLCQWDPKKACGFLDCDGNRLFVHKSEFAQQFRDGEEPPLGTRLSCVVGANASGKERACDILIEQPMPYGGPPSPYGGPPGSGHFAPKGGPPGPYGSPPGGAAKGAGKGRGPRLHGVVCQWDRRKACGFLECEGKRLFVHKTEFLQPFPDGAEPQPGTELTFVHGVDAKSGKERACEIQVEQVMGPYGRAPVPSFGGPGPGFGGPCFGGSGPGFGGPGRGFGGGMPHHGCMPFGGPMPGAGYGPYGGYPGYGAVPQQQRLFGKLVDWNPEKACGFVECTDPPGKRLFVHKTEFALPFSDGYEPPLGTPFSFFLGNDPKSGKQRAVDIRIQDAQHGPFGARRRLAGLLEEWTPEKGCGFIRARDTPGKKFFAHKTEFAVPFVDGEEPDLGCEVHFVLGHDPRSGKERAQDIQLGPLDESATTPTMLPPRLHGTLKEWNSQKACGFIECERPGKSTPGRLFAHKCEFAEPFEDGGEPALGTELSFVLGHDSKSGKERAVDIKLAVPGEEPPSKRPRTGG